MALNLKTLTHQFNTFSYRERMLVLLTGCVFVYLIWYAIIFSFVDDTKNKQNMQIIQLKQNIQKINRDTQQIIQNAASHKYLSLQAAESELLKKKQNLNDILKRVAGNLLNTTELVSLMKSILNADPDLTLLTLTTEPAERITDKDIAAIKTLYRQSITLKIQGHYFNIMTHLKKIESLKWQLLLDEFTYDAKHYPLGIATLKFHILTDEADGSTKFTTKT